MANCCWRLCYLAIGMLSAGATELRGSISEADSLYMQHLMSRAQDTTTHWMSRALDTTTTEDLNGTVVCDETISYKITKNEIDWFYCSNSLNGTAVGFYQLNYTMTPSNTSYPMKAYLAEDCTYDRDKANRSLASDFTTVAEYSSTEESGQPVTFSTDRREYLGSSILTPCVIVECDYSNDSCPFTLATVWTYYNASTNITTDTTSDSGSGQNKAIVAGIAVGAILAAVVVLALGYYCFFWRPAAAPIEKAAPTAAVVAQPISQVLQTAPRV